MLDEGVDCLRRAGDTMAEVDLRPHLILDGEPPSSQHERGLGPDLAHLVELRQSTSTRWWRAAAASAGAGTSAPSMTTS
jgi:hypothetical protein